MQIKTDISMLKSKGSTQTFLDFCEMERECQLNSEKTFDEPLFIAAVELVVNRLRNMELEEEK